MQGVFAAAPVTADAQLLVRLGLVHRDGEWIPYWESWVDWMRAQGWRRFGWYVWDQGPGLPGFVVGRLFRLLLLPRLPQACDGACHHRLDSDGLETGLGGNQRGAMAIAGLAPHRFAVPQVGLALLEPAAGDHLADDHFGGGADQPLG